MGTFVNFMTCVLFLYCITGIWTAPGLISLCPGKVDMDKPDCTRDNICKNKNTCTAVDFPGMKMKVCCIESSWSPDYKRICNKTHDCPRGYYGANCTPCPNCTEKGTNVEPNVCNRENGLCICKPGWYSSNCQEKCDKGYFGRNCVFKCTCDPEQCDHIVGCFTNKQSPNDTSAYPTPVTVPDSGISIQTVTMVTVPGIGVRTQTLTPISMYITVTCGVIGLLLLASIYCIKYRQIKGRRQENKYHKYPTGDISLNGVQNVSEYGEITEIDSYTCSNATEPSDLIKAYDHLDHHPSTSSENIHIYDDPRKESMHWQSKTGPIKQYYMTIYV